MYQQVAMFINMILICTRMLIEKLRVIHPNVDKIVKELRFFKGDKSYNTSFYANAIMIIN